MASVNERIAAARAEMNLTKRIRMLVELNDTLPSNKRLMLPRLMTNAYIQTAFDIIGERTA